MPFTCPVCHLALSPAQLARTSACTGCGFEIIVHEGIPALVRDSEPVIRAIEDARGDARASWYEDAQEAQWTGPYRHHVRKRIAYMRSALARFASAGGFPTAIDLGCGDGEHLRWLGDFAGELFASDYNLLRLRRAAAKEVANAVVMADLTDYPAADDSFDLVFCHHVIEHIPRVDLALAEIRRVLRPGGIALIGTCT